MAAIQEELDNNPTLPPFWPDEPPEHVTPQQWQLLNLHLRGPLYNVANAAREVGISHSRANNDIRRGLHAMVMRWRSLQNQHASQQWEIPAVIVITGSTSYEQARVVAKGWQGLSQSLKSLHGEVQRSLQIPS